MKKIFFYLMILTLCIGALTGCTETVSTDQGGNAKTEFSINETANVNNTKIKINSVTEVKNECAFEWDGSCESYTEPENAFFLVIDLTIENAGDDELNISSILSFELKTTDGEKADQSIMLDAVQSQLDDTVMPNDTLKGQIAYDVKESDQYYFYYEDSLLDSPIKFVINRSDIQEG